VSAGFDRLRPRTPQAQSASPLTTRQDTEGKRALYSAAPEAPRPRAGLVVECSACGERTQVSALHALRIGVPSFHLPMLRRYPSYVRCPACGKRAWTKLSITL
jgi:DNA-directed RNA polymerase subunit RPC12/RpoP